jgi:hypothetical protein
VAKAVAAVTAAAVAAPEAAAVAIPTAVAAAVAAIAAVSAGKMATVTRAVAKARVTQQRRSATTIGAFQTALHAAITRTGCIAM